MTEPEKIQHRPHGGIVHVVDDDAELREALTLLLEDQGYAVQTYPNAASFLSSVVACRPGCILLDIRMPGIDGLELQKQIVARECPLPIIFLSGYGTPNAGFDAALHGAVDFLVKPVRNEMLLDAVASAVEVSRDRVTRALQLERLTERERAVFKLVEAGKRNAEIATTLSVSQKTVEFHKKNLREKLEGRG